MLIHGASRTFWVGRLSALEGSVRISQSARPWSGRVLLSVGLVLGLCACSDEGPKTPEEVPTDLEPLYVMAREYRQDYEKGLERIVAGDEVAGRALLVAATDRIAVAAKLCASTRGCDMALFVTSMAQVAAERRAVTLAQGEAPADVEAESTLESSAAESRPSNRFVRLGETDLGEMIPLNDEVRAALNDWLTWNRPQLMQTYEHYQFLRPYIFPVYEEAGLPEALLFAIMAKESGGKVHAYSRAGAVGPLQFMRHTARRYGLYSQNGFDMRLDPVAATRANASYVTDQLEAFDDLGLALAAYNSGESRMRRLHRKLPDADFWDPRLHYELPTETRNYVPQTLAAALIFLYPEEFGIEFPVYDTLSTTVVLAEDISIGELTICLGETDNPKGWFRTLRNLNPRLKPAVRSKAGETMMIPSSLVSVYADRCLGDSPVLDVARLLHDADFPEQPPVVQYKVRRGDTLAKISASHGCSSVRDLAAINGIEAPDYVIHVGQRLSVPTCS
jgi:membrane-bound lytic murein transglycosylase D